MLLFLWLLSLLCVVGCWDETKYYGQVFKMRTETYAKMWEFLPSSHNERIVLWKNDGSIKDNRRKLVGNYFTVYNVTQSDSGEYSLKNHRGIVLSTSELVVEAKTQSSTVKSGDRFEVSFELPRDSCNAVMRFVTEDEYRQHKIVTRGRLDWDHYDLECSGFELLPPCGLVIEDVQTSCSGTLTFIDGNRNPGLVVSLTVEGKPVDIWKIGLSSGIVSLLVSCCCCMKRCCCKKSKSNEAETPDGEAGVNLEEYDHEPVAPQSYQHNPVTLYPAVPTEAPDGPSEPLVHSSPPPMPPAYSEVSFLADTSSAPTVSFPLDSGSEPRYELKGLKFDSPLSLDSNQSDTYTSDKLNFL